MSFRISTNIPSMNAQVNVSSVGKELNDSLERLSSGLRINKAADDASGMAIADSLRAQGNALGQAIRNANDAVGLIQIGDKAMDEQSKILDTIKTKATQAAQDSQNSDSRKAIQADIVRLVEQLDNIASQTSYNGMAILAGGFTNREFQVGAYSNETIKASIGSTSSSKLGSVRKETSATVTAAGSTTLTFKNPTGGSDISLESVTISTSAGTGLGAVAETINKNADATGVRAFANVQSTGTAAVAAGDINALSINGTEIGNVTGVEANDGSGTLVNAINAYKSETGVEASIDSSGRLNLSSVDGRGINVTTSAGGTAVLNIASVSGSGHENYGRLTLTQLGGNDIDVTATGVMASVVNSGGAQATMNLRDVRGQFDAATGAAGGAYANSVLSGDAGSYLGSGVTTREGAMMVMDIAESAIQGLDKIRSDLGSVQNQLEVTVNNISTTQVNVYNAESQIRDVDFGNESANFSKQNILMQSGSYALAQANIVQQNVLRLLA